MVRLHKLLQDIDNFYSSSGFISFAQDTDDGNILKQGNDQLSPEAFELYTNLIRLADLFVLDRKTRQEQKQKAEEQQRAQGIEVESVIDNTPASLDVYQNLRTIAEKFKIVVLNKSGYKEFKRLIGMYSGELLEELGIEDEPEENTLPDLVDKAFTNLMAFLKRETKDNPKAFNIEATKDVLSKFKTVNAYIEENAMKTYKGEQSSAFSQAGGEIQDESQFGATEEAPIEEDPTTVPDKEDMDLERARQQGSSFEQNMPDGKVNPLIEGKQLQEAGGKSGVGVAGYFVKRTDESVIRDLNDSIEYYSDELAEETDQNRIAVLKDILVATDNVLKLTKTISELNTSISHQANARQELQLKQLEPKLKTEDAKKRYLKFKLKKLDKIKLINESIAEMNAEQDKYKKLALQQDIAILQNQAEGKLAKKENDNRRELIRLITEQSAKGKRTSKIVPKKLEDLTPEQLQNINTPENYQLFYGKRPKDAPPLRLEDLTPEQRSFMTVRTKPDTRKYNIVITDQLIKQYLDDIEKAKVETVSRKDYNKNVSEKLKDLKKEKDLPGLIVHLKQSFGNVKEGLKKKVVEPIIVEMIRKDFDQIRAELKGAKVVQFKEAIDKLAKAILAETDPRVKSLSSRQTASKAIIDLINKEVQGVFKAKNEQLRKTYNAIVTKAAEEKRDPKTITINELNIGMNTITNEQFESLKLWIAKTLPALTSYTTIEPIYYKFKDDLQSWFTSPTPDNFEEIETAIRQLQEDGKAILRQNNTAFKSSNEHIIDIIQKLDEIIDDLKRTVEQINSQYEQSEEIKEEISEQPTEAPIFMSMLTGPEAQEPQYQTYEVLEEDDAPVEISQEDDAPVGVAESSLNPLFIRMSNRKIRNYKKAAGSDILITVMLDTLKDVAVNLFAANEAKNSGQTTLALLLKSPQVFAGAAGGYAATFALKGKSPAAYPETNLFQVKAHLEKMMRMIPIDDMIRYVKAVSDALIKKKDVSSSSKDLVIKEISKINKGLDFILNGIDVVQDYNEKLLKYNADKAGVEDVRMHLNEVETKIREAKSQINIGGLS